MQRIQPSDFILYDQKLGVLEPEKMSTYQKQRNWDGLFNTWRARKIKRIAEYI